VAGTGGINDQAVKQASGQVDGDHTYVASYKGYGYLLIEVNSSTIKGTMFGVDKDSGAKSIVETFKVDLLHHKVS